MFSKKGQKNWRNLHRRFDIKYVVSVKSMVKISSIFVAFLANMNFTYIQTICNESIRF